MSNEWLLWIAGGVLTVMFYLLKQKDERQQKEIESLKTSFDDDVKVLWQRHDEDVERLRQLELAITGRYYMKEEMDIRLERLETSLTNGLDGLGQKIDLLTTALLQRSQHERRS